MYFGLSEDQIFFQQNVAKFLSDHASLDIIKKITDGHGDSFQQEVHRGLVNLGISSMLIPEEYNGLGLDLLFATAVSQSLGAGVAPVPFVGSYVMAPIAITYGGDANQKINYLKRMSENSIRLGVGFSEYIGARENASITISNNVVNGRALFVLDVAGSSHVMVSNKLGTIGIVDINEDGVEVIKLTTVDKTRNYSEIRFKDVEIDVLKNTIDSSDAIVKSVDAGRIILAADSIGASQTLLNKAVEYSKERKQFGRVIGSFQAVKHMCAEMAAELEPCYSITWHAAHAQKNIQDEARLYACQASSHTSEVSKMIAKKATEVHGGMGFTDLMGIHYWFKRIGLNRQLLGSPELIREEAAIIQDF